MFVSFIINFVNVIISMPHLRSCTLLAYFRTSIVKSMSVQMELHVFQIMEMTQLHAYALLAMKENTATNQPEEVKSDICPHLFPYQLL